MSLLFYIGVHSSGGAGSFTCNLNREVVLDGDYQVAVSSISRYYQTEMKDLVFVRNTRAAEPVVNIAKAYTPTPSNMHVKFEKYLANSPPVIIIQAKSEYYYEVKVGAHEVVRETVFPKSPEFQYYDSQIATGVAFESSIHGVKIQVIDLLEGNARLRMEMNMSAETLPTYSSLVQRKSPRHVRC